MINVEDLLSHIMNPDFFIQGSGGAIKELVDFYGKLIFEELKPVGMPRKRLDTQELKDLGWKPMWSFEDTFRKAYSCFL